MLIVISPAKTLDFENAVKTGLTSIPEYTDKAQQLVDVLKTFDIDELKKLMNISDNLASLNKIRFETWSKKSDKKASRQAICAFKGAVYTGLNVNDWTDDDFNFAQNHLRILSGLYGVLRPLDLINPYRLEMGTKLQIDDYNNLYKFWDKTIKNNILQLVEKQDSKYLINLASDEYFKALKLKKTDTNIITPVFKDFKNGDYKVISIYAKKARGMMSRFIITNRITEPESIKEFNDVGYYYNDRLSKDNSWVFTRD